MKKTIYTIDLDSNNYLANDRNNYNRKKQLISKDECG